MLKRITSEAIDKRGQSAPDGAVLQRVATILNDVRMEGDAALLRYGQSFGDIESGAAHIIGTDELQASLTMLEPDVRELLEHAATRIRTFAEAQRASILECSIAIEGGKAGHRVTPLSSAACYAPGGRYALPSSVLMTVIPAIVAGVERVWVVSPRPNKYTLASAAIAGANQLIAIGGAQAIAAVAYGTATVPRFDIVVGPGNKWVTAAKQLVFGEIAIDMLAGPSELLILADDLADPRLIAADLLAQAEHDPDAIVGLVALSEPMIAAVEQELRFQLLDLPTREIACCSLANGFAVVVRNMQEAANVSNAIAPEHLSLHVNDGDRFTRLLKNYGAIFIGSKSAEVFGDYGLGPNHVLPTGRAARYRGGLSVLDFLRVQTWMEIDNVPSAMASEIARFARLEGLEAHARSASIRSKRSDC